MSKQISEKQLMKQSTNEWDKSWGIWSKCWLAYLIIFFPEKAQEQDVLSQALILEQFDKAGFLHSLPSMFSLLKSLGKVIYFKFKTASSNSTEMKILAPQVLNPVCFVPLNWGEPLFISSVHAYWTS